MTAKVISIEELTQAIKEKVDTSIRYNGEFQLCFYTLREKCTELDKDLDTVEFDLENSGTARDFADQTQETSLFGFHTIEDLTFLGCYAGGDWEFPVFFIVYMDTDGKLRAYIPKNGNCYNQLANSAFGNYTFSEWLGEDEKGKIDSIALKTQYGLDVSEEDSECLDDDLIDYDFEKMKADILNAITVDK